MHLTAKRNGLRKSLRVSLGLNRWLMPATGARRTLFSGTLRTLASAILIHGCNRKARSRVTRGPLIGIRRWGWVGIGPWDSTNASSRGLHLNTF